MQKKNFQVSVCMISVLLLTALVAATLTEDFTQEALSHNQRNDLEDRVLQQPQNTGQEGVEEKKKENLMQL